MKYILLMGMLVIAQSCFATTWGKTKVDDPIKKGKKCKVNEPYSSGSYIYRWPEKYDQVFWPYTDGNNIWFCEKSGFVSFMYDFDDITDNDVKKVREYLKDNKLKDPSTKELIETLIEINEIRDFKPEYRNTLTRVYARWYQDLGDIEKSNEYRKKAYLEIEEFLTRELEKGRKLEYLYLAANYARYFGDSIKSDEYIVLLEKEIVTINDEELKGFGEYLTGLVKDTKYIVPGKKLDPEVPDKNT